MIILCHCLSNYKTYVKAVKSSVLLCPAIRTPLFYLPLEGGSISGDDDGSDGGGDDGDDHDHEDQWSHR